MSLFKNAHWFQDQHQQHHFEPGLGCFAWAWVVVPEGAVAAAVGAAEHAGVPVARARHAHPIAWRWNWSRQICWTRPSRSPWARSWSAVRTWTSWRRSAAAAAAGVVDWGAESGCAWQTAHIPRTNPPARPFTKVNKRWRLVLTARLISWLHNNSTLKSVDWDKQWAGGSRALV